LIANDPRRLSVTELGVKGRWSFGKSDQVVYICFLIEMISAIITNHAVPIDKSISRQAALAALPSFWRNPGPEEASCHLPLFNQKLT